jgi:hypothetical protein
MTDFEAIDIESYVAARMAEYRLAEYREKARVRAQQTADWIVQNRRGKFLAYAGRAWLHQTGERDQGKDPIWSKTSATRYRHADLVVMRAHSGLSGCPDVERCRWISVSAQAPRIKLSDHLRPHADGLKEFVMDAVAVDEPLSAVDLARKYLDQNMAPGTPADLVPLLEEFVAEQVDHHL